MTEIEKKRNGEAIARLKIFKQAAGIKSYYDMSRSIGASVTLAHQYASGHITIGMSFAEKLRDVYGLNPNWLLFGQGEMYINNNPTAEQAREQRVSECLAAFPIIREAFGIFIENATPDEFDLLIGMCSSIVRRSKKEADNPASPAEE